jgi:hypothetical protein
MLSFAPKYPQNNIFNPADFVIEDGHGLSEQDANLLYIRKSGSDVVRSNLTFTNPLTYQAVQKLHGGAQIYNSSMAFYLGDNETIGLSLDAVSGLQTPSINGISSTTIGYLDATSSIQTQLDNAAALTL